MTRTIKNTEWIDPALADELVDCENPDLANVNINHKRQNCLSVYMTRYSYLLLTEYMCAS